MKQRDHRALAYYLLDCAGDKLLWKRKWHRRVFLFGCICPDYIPLTYLRGFAKSRAMHGHHAAYSGAHIRKSIKRLQEHGVWHVRDCFRLGTLMHYLADSFTYPHSASFQGDMRMHRQYEKDLHGCFAQYLQNGLVDASLCTQIEEGLTSYISRIRREYSRRAGSPECDCQQIVRSCSSIFCALCEKSAR